MNRGGEKDGGGRVERERRRRVERERRRREKDEEKKRKAGAALPEIAAHAKTFTHFAKGHGPIGAAP